MRIKIKSRIKIKNACFAAGDHLLRIRSDSTASAHSWVVWASWRDCCLYGIPLLEFVCVSLLVV